MDASGICIQSVSLWGNVYVSHDANRHLLQQYYQSLACRKGRLETDEPRIGPNGGQVVIRQKGWYPPAEDDIYEGECIDGMEYYFVWVWVYIYIWVYIYENGICIFHTCTHTHTSIHDDLYINLKWYIYLSYWYWSSMNAIYIYIWGTPQKNLHFLILYRYLQWFLHFWRPFF